MCRVTSFGENWPEESKFGMFHSRQVPSPSRITLEYNGKIRLHAGVETGFAEAVGGEIGIRTLGTLAGSTVFETAPFDHSGTSPRLYGGG